MTEKEIMIEIAAKLAMGGFALAMAKIFAEEGRLEKAEDYFRGSEKCEADARRLHAKLLEVRKG